MITIEERAWYVPVRFGVVSIRVLEREGPCELELALVTDGEIPGRTYVCVPDNEALAYGRPIALPVKLAHAAGVLVNSPGKEIERQIMLSVSLVRPKMHKALRADTDSDH